MTQPGASLNDSASDAVFLDIEMEVVQMDFAVGAPHPLGKGNPFGSSVH
jgi:hypothetical protein